MLVVAQPVRAQLTCGDAVLDIGEQCDEGGANGSAASCCNADCTFRAAGETCRAAADVCDAEEQCSGVDGACPADDVALAGTPCRAAVDVCDAPESCDGISTACPGDAVEPPTTACRAALDVCDLAENCDGATVACPPDAKSTALCRASAGACDIAEFCDGVADACPANGFQPNGTSCADTHFCNGAETCQAGVCTNGPLPCLICEETSQRCLNEFCPAAPLACRRAVKSSLRLRNFQDDDRHDKLAWKMSRGPSTSVAELSDPRANARYTLCLYAGTAPATLIQEMSVGPRPFAWTPRPANGWLPAPPDGDGFNYVDPPARQAGAYRIRLRPSDAGRTRITVRGRGVNLGDPLYTSALPLPVTVQLINHETGICWDGMYEHPRQNSVDSFKALR